MSDKPVELDSHRGMAAQKATSLRRLLADAEAHAAVLRDQKSQIEDAIAGGAGGVVARRGSESAVCPEPLFCDVECTRFTPPRFDRVGSERLGPARQRELSNFPTSIVFRKQFVPETSSYEGENMLVIHPDECIDCGVCVPECPVDAIKLDTEPGLEKSEGSQSRVSDAASQGVRRCGKEVAGTFAD